MEASRIFLLLLGSTLSQGQNIGDILKLVNLANAYITPQGEVSEECLEAGELMKLDLSNIMSLPDPRLDASSFLPPAGLMSDANAIHSPGSFSGCLNTEGEEKELGQYCLFTVVKYSTFVELQNISNSKKAGDWTVTRNEHFHPENSLLQSMSGNVRDTCPETFKFEFIFKVGKCIPKVCTTKDIITGGMNYLVLLNQTVPGIVPGSDPLVALPLSCHTKDETIEMTTGDIVMIAVVSLFVLLISLSTWLDVGITVLGLPYLPHSLLPPLQGFSAYHNIMKICSVPSTPNDGSNLACINGIKYISISWICLGHVLWEYTPVSGYGAFTSSATAIKIAAESTAFSAVWNGLIGVDSFFVVGGCLLAFHTLKEMDKAKGGNVKMWAMFYVHRYIRLTGVYAIIIGLHATLLKYFATGPQSHLVTSMVNKCTKGWWLNLLYINNFANYIYPKGPAGAVADCVNVSWYMAIDMQFFILTPILLTIFWRKPIAGYVVTFLLMCGGTASQLYFTVTDDEYFHGGFDYYIKPWNRSQPYLIGIMVGHILHNMRSTPRLRINPFMNMWVWAGMTALASAALYGVTPYNLVADINVALPCADCVPEEECGQAPVMVRALFNGFAKIAWGLGVAWVILACAKGRGGVVNSILSWSAWVPLARVQYCVYLLHRSIIYIINSWTEDAVRYTHTLLAVQFVSILAIATFAAFVFVIIFEAPIVHMEKLLFASLGMGRMPQKRKD